MNDRCPDCGVAPGRAHDDGCDVARCLHTGAQRLLHEMGVNEYLGHDLDAHDCGNDVWTGEWPGEADCKRLGLWCYWGPDYGEEGFVPCDPSHPGAQVDLNRLGPWGGRRWDREMARWEKA